MHFNGAGGNVAAGKYNDGTQEKRTVLATRLADNNRPPFVCDDAELRLDALGLRLDPNLRREDD